MNHVNDVLDGSLAFVAVLVTLVKGFIWLVSGLWWGINQLPAWLQITISIAMGLLAVAWLFGNVCGEAERFSLDGARDPRFPSRTLVGLAFFLLAAIAMLVAAIPR